jgi:hypothetical protein
MEDPEALRRTTAAARKFFALNLLAVAGVVIGSNLGTAFFLETYGAKFLPHAFVLVAVVAIAAERVLRVLEQRVEPLRLLRATIFVLATGILLTWAGLAADVRGATILLYVLPELAAFAVFSQVWNLASRHFDFSESKKRFPLIAAGGSLGGALGGAGVSLVSGVAAPMHALALWLLGLLCIPALAGAIARGGTVVEKWKASEEKAEKARGKLLRRFQLRVHSFFANPFLLVLCVFVVLGAVLTQLLDFQSQLVFSMVYTSPQDLAQFLGLFTSLSFVAGLILQTLILSPLVRKIGAGNAAFIFPLCTAGAGLWLARWPGLPAAITGAFTRRYLKGSFFTVLIDLLLNALHPQERNRMRSLLKGPIAAMTTIVASLVILAVQDSGGAGDVAMLTVFFGLVFICTAFLLRRKYVACLIEQIAKGHAGIAESTSFAHGSLEVDIHPDRYIEALETADDDIATILFEEYRDKLSDGVIDRLPSLHARSSGRVRGAIVRTVRARAREKDRAWLESLLRSNDEESVIALFMEHGDFMEPMISETALEIVNSPATNSALRRASLYHVCLSPNQYFAYKGHLKLEAAILSGNRDELLWALEIVRNLKERKLLKEFEPFLADPDVADAWLEVMEFLEDGRDGIFARMLLGVFHTDSPSRRRAALKLLERVPAHETFDELWASMKDLTSEDQAAVIRIGVRWQRLGAESLAPLLATAALPIDLFLMAVKAWKNLEPTKSRPVHEEWITARLRSALSSAREDHAVIADRASGADGGSLAEIVLGERMLQLTIKSLAWKTIRIMALDDFNSVYQGLISEEKGVADRAMETIENSGGVADTSAVKELRGLLVALREPSSAGVEAGRARAPIRDVLVRLAADRDHWVAAVSLAELARRNREFRVTRSEIAARLKPAALDDPYVAEALALLPAA